MLFPYIFSVALALALAGCSLMPAAPLPAAGPTVWPTGSFEGALAPDFTLTDLSGQEVRLSDYRGKPVMLNFWSTWCRPCRAEMPDLQKAYAEFGEEGLAIIAINYQESTEKVKSFVDEYQLTFPVVIDHTTAVIQEYEVRGIPATFFLDREGKIFAKRVGTVSYAVIENFVQKVP